MDAPDELNKAVAQAVRRLIEHADSVLVITTLYDPTKGVTHTSTESKGNIYANIAAAQEWVNAQSADQDTEKKPFD